MPTSSGRFLLFSLVVALLASLVFTPGLPGEFVFDDHPNIVNNKSIQHDTPGIEGLYKAIATPQVSGNMRTLPTVTFAIDYWRGGGADPATFKTTNIVIHALTALALAWFFRSLLLAAGVQAGRVQWAAPALALAWALHPLHVSSVLYAVQRLQTMGTLFLVLALIAYLAARRAQVDGQPSRTVWLLAALCWVAAMSCKEDSVLLPAYALALELTVLRFRAANPLQMRALRRIYGLVALAGFTFYFLFVLPYYWTWEPYGGRDFSTVERLLTQARVLCIYLWQVVLPLPRHMPFYYDWIQPSRGLFQPWTTVPAIIVVVALLTIAWRLRGRWPLFSLGVLLFFSAHSITSNVLGLELAFEHRNHFAIIGAVLAGACVLAKLIAQLRMSKLMECAVISVLVMALGSATMLRARDWHSNVELHRASTESAPTSARAWAALCAATFRAGGGAQAAANNPLLDEAVGACYQGTVLAPYALNNFALLVVLKSLRGDVTPDDWDRYRRQMDTVQMNWDNRRSVQVLIHHSRNGVMLDRAQMIATLAALTSHSEFSAFQLAAFGYYIMNDLDDPEAAMDYFMAAIRQAPPGDPFPMQLRAELLTKGRQDLARIIDAHMDVKGTTEHQESTPTSPHDSDLGRTGS